MRADRAWSRETDIMEGLERSRLNPLRGIIGRLGDPQVQQALQRYVENVRSGLARLTELIAQATV
jgi:hypothetical protein